MNALLLQDGNTRVELLPQRGGAIGRYCSEAHGQTHEWLLPAHSGQSMTFPMVPFCSRIDGGRFRFGNRQIVLAPNMAREPHAIHGHGWQRRWRVAQSSATRAMLSYRHEADAWPWAYEARQSFTLRAMALRVGMSVRNLAGEPMPVGMGLHPFFPRTPGVRVRARVRGIWETDERLMPTRCVALPQGLDLAGGALIDAQVLDNVFAGWDGRCEVRWPERRAMLTLRASGVFGQLVIYAPPGEGFFCVEPTSQVTDAFNMRWRGEAGHGAIVLPPQATLTGTLWFRPRLEASQPACSTS